MTHSIHSRPRTPKGAEEAGRHAALNGIAYDTGKTLFTPQEKDLLLAWSQGHNAARVQRILSAA